MKIKDTFYVIYILTRQTFRFIHYLIKNKDDTIILLMQKENFNKKYNIQYDGENYIIHTNIVDLVFDIDNYENAINQMFNEHK